MPPCLSAPKVPAPGGLSLLLPTLSLSPSLPGVGLCCTFEPPPVPGSPFVIPLGLLIPGGAAVLIQGAMGVIMSAIDQLNALLDQITASCPLEDDT